MTENDMEAFKRAYDAVPSQDNEGYTPDRGSFKCGFLAGLRHRDGELKAMERCKNQWKDISDAQEKARTLLRLALDTQEVDLSDLHAANAQLTKELNEVDEDSRRSIHNLEARVKLFRDGLHWTMRELEIAEAESHQPMVALKPWIDGNPDRSRLDLAHLSACSFRAWGSVVKAIHMLKAQLGGAPTGQDERREK